MKKIFTVVIAVLAMITGFMAEAGGRTKTYTGKHFNSLEMSGMVQAELNRAPECRMELTAPEELLKYVVVKVERGKLDISVHDVPASIQRKYRKSGDYEVKAVISMPELCGIEMSGATSLYCKDAFDIENKEFELDLSGASKITGLDIKAGSMDAEVSGASVLRMKGEILRSEIECGGASDVSLDFVSDVMDVELSGASKLNIGGKLGSTKIEVSGASKLIMRGNARNMRAKVSGASKLNASGLSTEVVDVSTSGASSADVNASRSLVASVSGTSNIRYQDNPGLKVSRYGESRQGVIRAVTRSE